jgi:tape measure domain-containing protein
MDFVEIGGIRLQIVADATSLQKALEHSRKRLKRYERQTENVSRSVQKNFSRMAQFAKIYIGYQAVDAFRMLGQNLINTADQVERLKISLISLKRDTAKGLATFNKLDEWAKNMPIRTEEAIDQFRRLTAMGLNPTITQMELITDTVSALGGGVDTFRGLARALGQMASKGKVAGEEMRQLAEHGFPVYDVLMKKLQLTGDQLRDMSRQGVTAQIGLEAIFKGMEERYGGTAKRMMTSWKGLMDILIDRWWRFQRAITEASSETGTVFQHMKAGLLGFIRYFEKKYKSWASAMVTITQQAISFISDILYGGAQIMDIIMPLFTKIYQYAVEPLIKAFRSLPPWMQTLGVLGGIILGPKIGFVLSSVFIIYDQLVRVAKMSQWFEKMGSSSENLGKIKHLNAKLRHLELRVEKFQKRFNEADNKADEINIPNCLKHIEKK